MNTLSQQQTQSLKIEDSVKQYFELTEQAKLIEKALKELRPSIEAHIALESNTTKIVESTTVKIGDYVATITPANRENFDLKTAKTQLNQDLIKPFLKTTSYLTLKINKLVG